MQDKYVSYTIKKNPTYDINNTIQLKIAANLNINELFNFINYYFLNNEKHSPAARKEIVKYILLNYKISTFSLHKYEHKKTIFKKYNTSVLYSALKANDPDEISTLFHKLINLKLNNSDSTGVAEIIIDLFIKDKSIFEVMSELKPRSLDALLTNLSNLNKDIITKNQKAILIEYLITSNSNDGRNLLHSLFLERPESVEVLFSHINKMENRIFSTTRKIEIINKLFSQPDSRVFILSALLNNNKLIPILSNWLEVHGMQNHLTIIHSLIATGYNKNLENFISRYYKNIKHAALIMSIAVNRTGFNLEMQTRLFAMAAYLAKEFKSIKIYVNNVEKINSTFLIEEKHFTTTFQNDSTALITNKKKSEFKHEFENGIYRGKLDTSNKNYHAITFKYGLPKDVASYIFTFIPQPTHLRENDQSSLLKIFQNTINSPTFLTSSHISIFSNPVDEDKNNFTPSF